jgi:hypothetical protein
MSDGVDADFRDMIMERLTSLKNTLEEALAGRLIRARIWHENDRRRGCVEIRASCSQACRDFCGYAWFQTELNDECFLQNPISTRLFDF